MSLQPRDEPNAITTKLYPGLKYGEVMLLLGLDARVSRRIDGRFFGPRTEFEQKRSFLKTF